jgi:hypothetical protein
MAPRLPHTQLQEARKTFLDYKIPYTTALVKLFLYAILSASKGTMLARSALLIPREVGGAASLKTHPPERRDCPVTTMEILTLCLVIIGICGLFIQANKK